MYKMQKICAEIIRFDNECAIATSDGKPTKSPSYYVKGSVLKAWLTDSNKKYKYTGIPKSIAEQNKDLYFLVKPDLAADAFNTDVFNGATGQELGNISQIGLHNIWGNNDTEQYNADFVEWLTAIAELDKEPK